MRKFSHRNYLLILSTLFAILAIALAIHPVSRGTWALENSLVLFLLLGVGLSYRKFLLSRVSYTLIFAFLCLHEIGAHYTYSQVPYDEWFRSAFGVTLNELIGFQRNQYDRLVHFAYGLLLSYPIREMFIRVAAVRGFWAYFLPFDLTVSTSAAFEMFEWAAAMIFAGDVGTAYLGMQGDEWDTHKDMALATLGAFITMSITAAINLSLQRDFAAEFIESLRVKSRRPLGEDSLARMQRENNHKQ